MRISQEELDRLFAHHPPNNDATKELHEAVRSECCSLAQWFNAWLPDSREKSLALTNIQQAMWAANAAIAIHISGGDALGNSADTG